MSSFDCVLNSEIKASGEERHARTGSGMPSQPPPWARALLREQRQLRAEVMGLRALLERRGAGPFDAADGDLLSAIARASHGTPFTSREIWILQQADEQLSSALLAADVDSARALGHALARLAASPPTGVVIEALRARRDGKQWRVVLASSASSLTANSRRRRISA